MIEASGKSSGNVIECGLGNDGLSRGWRRSDTASYTGSTAAVTVDLSLQGGAQNTGGAGTDTLSAFANLGVNGVDRWPAMTATMSSEAAAALTGRVCAAPLHRDRDDSFSVVSFRSAGSATPFFPNGRPGSGC